LTGTTPAGLQLLSGVTGAGGAATFLVTAPLGTLEFVASAGSVRANAVELVSAR
jgi:hypothetical protein